MATKRKVRRYAEGDFVDTESESGEWAGDEDYGDGTTRAERVAMARSPSYKPKFDAGEAGMMEKEPEENFKPTPTPTPKAKAPIVTKDQLSAFQKKHGSDKTLRDYMNNQQGLTRRGEKAVDEIAEVASKRADDRKAAAPEAKPALKYQSLQDRAKSYADERAKSGVGMYGTKKSEPKEERKPLPLKSTKSETGNAFMGVGMKKGGSVASRRADGIASKGKTKGRMV